MWLFRLGVNGRSLIVETKLVVEMKSGDTIAPYEFKRVSFFAAVLGISVSVILTMLLCLCRFVALHQFSNYEAHK